MKIQAILDPQFRPMALETRAFREAVAASERPQRIAPFGRAQRRLHRDGLHGRVPRRRGRRAQLRLRRAHRQDAAVGLRRLPHRRRRLEAAVRALARRLFRRRRARLRPRFHGARVRAAVRGRLCRRSRGRAGAEALLARDGPPSGRLPHRLRRRRERPQGVRRHRRQGGSIPTRSSGIRNSTPIRNTSIRAFSIRCAPPRRRCRAWTPSACPAPARS